jgi:ribosomal-protein-alanine N-acetyltransferase
LTALYEIETERLRLRPLVIRDLDELHRLFTDPDVRRYLWDNEVIPIQQTQWVIRESLRLFRTEGIGLWGIRPRKGADFLAGFCGFWYFRDPPELEILFGIAPSRWGRGFATEATRAILRYGFDHKGFDSIAGSADAPNTVSLRVMEKTGMKVEKKARLKRFDTVFYRIQREDFPAAADTERFALKPLD